MKEAPSKSACRSRLQTTVSSFNNETIEKFEKNLIGNLYKIWNRMSSGTYFPPPVKGVSIPKKSGGERLLGIPTVSDRIAQETVKLFLEPILDPIFDKESYGYRKGKSAHDAIAITRKRCWQYDWVVEFDIKGLFDNIDHNLLLKALKHNCKTKWVLLYVNRWLKAPIREVNLPVSHLLKNLSIIISRFQWMEKVVVLIIFLLNVFGRV